MMKKMVILMFLLSGCLIEPDIEPPCLENPCACNVSIPNSTKDSEGYYHLDIAEEGYTDFTIYVEASKIKDEYRYNGTSVIEAYFDSDTYWVIGDTLSFVIPLYNSFESLKSSPYWDATPLPVGETTVYLSQFEGYLVPVISAPRVYFQRYEVDPSGYISEYEPSDPELFDWTKKIAGPIPYYMQGDTLTVFTKVMWDAGSSSVQKEIETKIILE